MTKMQKKKEEIKLHLISRGWKEDNYGHLIKEFNDDKYRMKFQETSLRYEVQLKRSDGSKQWMRLKSGYYNQLLITEDGKISGMRKL